MMAAHRRRCRRAALGVKEQANRAIRGRQNLRTFMDSSSIRVSGQSRGRWKNRCHSAFLPTVWQNFTQKRNGSSSREITSDKEESTNPTLTLEYLPFRAMAETTRFILHYGGIGYRDEAVWGLTFHERRQQGRYPFNVVPVMHVSECSDGATVTVAQSGTIARYAAKLAGCYPTDPQQCALSDAVFELGQEMCTINPLVNCYVGSQHAQIKDWYFSKLPTHLMMLERQLFVAGELLRKPSENSSEVDLSSASSSSSSSSSLSSELHFFGGRTPSHADFNVYHHLSNALLVDPNCVEEVSGELTEWMGRMETLPSMKSYLEKRPKLVGIGENPGLLDKTGRLVTQRDPEGIAWLMDDGCFTFDNPYYSE